MLLNPSGIRLPQGQELRVEEIDNGLFSVKNAYDGEYEYFEDRPIVFGEDDKVIKIAGVATAEHSELIEITENNLDESSESHA